MAGWIFGIAAIVCLGLRWFMAGRHFDATPLLYALAPVNAAAFTLRRKIAWKSGPVAHPNESKNGLFGYAKTERKLEGRERVLRGRYRLDALRDASSVRVYRENLYVLDLLDRHVPATPRGAAIRAIDVGSQDFRYAFALSRWLGTRADDVSLTGIELEGDRVYDDLHSRKEHAEAYARECDANVDYRVADFLAHDETNVDQLFFFFPFVLEYALVRWGLPRRFFLPERMFVHAFQMLKPGGTVVVMNHTEDERRRQLEILSEAGFDVVQTGRAESHLVDYADDIPERSMTIARKPAQR